MDIVQAAEAEAAGRDQTAIASIVAGLFALLGLSAGVAPARISLQLRRQILRVLRPAESAVRRLIVILAQRLKPKAAPPRPAPVGLVRAGPQIRRRWFQLFDPRLRFASPQSGPASAPSVQPRIRSLADGALAPAWLRRPPPKAEAATGARARTSDGDGLIDSANLLRRLEALQGALGDLPRQARRLVRAMARRSKSERLKRQSPLRPGTAPGFRRRPSHEVDHVLERCQWRAREALAFDTS